MRAEDRRALLELIQSAETAVVREIAKCIIERRAAEFWLGVGCIEALLDLESKLAARIESQEPLADTGKARYSARSGGG